MLVLTLVLVRLGANIGKKTKNNRQEHAQPPGALVLFFFVFALVLVPSSLVVVRVRVVFFLRFCAVVGAQSNQHQLQNKHETAERARNVFKKWPIGRQHWRASTKNRHEREKPPDAKTARREKTDKRPNSLWLRKSGKRTSADSSPKAQSRHPMVSGSSCALLLFVWILFFFYEVDISLGPMDERKRT